MWVWLAAHMQTVSVGVASHMQTVSCYLISGIPTLIILDWNGTVINANGRNAVAADQQGLVNTFVCTVYECVCVCEGDGPP